MEKGQGKGTDTLKKDNDFVRRGDVKRLLENTVCLHEELPAQIDIIPAADVMPVRHGRWKLGICQERQFDWATVSLFANVPNYYEISGDDRYAELPAFTLRLCKGHAEQLAKSITDAIAVEKELPEDV